MFVFGGIGPDAVSLSLRPGYGRAHAKYLFDIDPQYGRVQSGGLPLLINDANRLTYGEVVVEYALNAYTVTYGEVVFEYILGGIVEADFTSILEINSLSDGSRESAAAFISIIDIKSLTDGQVEVEAAFDSILDITSLFPAERTSNAEFLSVVEFVGEWVPDDAEIDAWAFTLGGEATPASRYENYDFNSFATVEGRYYAVGDSGIYELGGDDDDGVGIAGNILTGARPQGVDRLQRMPILYITGRSTGVLHCTLVDEEGVAHDYTAERPLGARETRQRVKLGKGLKMSFWQPRISNEAGQDFELENVGTLPDVLKRRVG
ncbi:hypothetical protein BH20PSE1_BH20PSE1_00910 [soil metagenome]